MLSVVIPAHDAARWIGDALASVRAQPVHLPVEVVVVTDRCRDNTAAIARAAGARVIDSPAPGAAAARNAGVDASHGAFIAFLDADDLWPADSLGDRLALLESVPEAALVFGDYRQFERTSDVLWNWVCERMNEPVPEGVMGHTGAVDLELRCARTP